MGRKIVCSLMTLVLVLGLAACGDMSGSAPDSTPVFSDVEDEEVLTTITTEDVNSLAAAPTTTATTEAEEEETAKRTTATTAKKATAKTTKKTTKAANKKTTTTTTKATVIKATAVTTTTAKVTTKKTPTTTTRKPAPTTTKTTTKKSTTAPTTAPLSKVYGAGETWRVDGEWEFTINSVEITEACNQFADAVGEQVVLIHYTYKNIGNGSDSVYFSLGNVYDEEGEAADTYPCTHAKAPKYCIAGTKCTASKACMLPNASKAITIAMERYNSNNKKEKATFKVPVTKGANNADDAETTGYARVSGEFTYKYNNFVGTRGDSGAKVMLIPMNDKVKTYDNSSACLFARGEYESGIIVRICDGYGKFDTGLNVVPAGKYLALVVSGNTTAGQRFNDPEGWEEDIREEFGAYFSETDIKKLMLGIGYQKISTTTLDMKAGEAWTLSDDFGITYY